MSTARPSHSQTRAGRSTDLRTQKVDILASMLLSALLVIGMLVMLLFVVWLTQTLSWQAGEIKIDQERVAGRGDHAEGFERDIAPPGEEEIQQLTEPTLAESIEALTSAATNVAASLNVIDSTRIASVDGAGQGDSRPPGPLGEGDDIVPRFERWELRFQAKGLRDYAEQLDYFNIELACVGGGVSTVDYASSLATSPQKRSGTSASENKLARLYFMWRTDGPLKEFDQQLLERAGVMTRSRQLLKFIPKDLEDRLAQAEMQYAKSKGISSVGNIAKTVFESQAAAGGTFEFVVVRQLYREPRK